MSIPSVGGLSAAAADAGTAQSVSVAEDSDRLLRPKAPEIDRDDVDTDFDDEDVGELKGVSDDELADREFVPNMPSVNDKSRVGTRYLYPNDPVRRACLKAGLYKEIPATDLLLTEFKSHLRRSSAKSDLVEISARLHLKNIA